MGPFIQKSRKHGLEQIITRLLFLQTGILQVRGLFNLHNQPRKCCSSGRVVCNRQHRRAWGCDICAAILLAAGLVWLSTAIWRISLAEAPPETRRLQGPGKPRSPAVSRINHVTVTGVRGERKKNFKPMQPLTNSESSGQLFEGLDAS